MPFAVPMIWREPKDHSSDCYFYLTKTIGITSKSRHTVEYPDLPSAMRPVPHSDILPVPQPPENVIFSDDNSDRREQQSDDTNFVAGASSEHHFLTQGDSNDLVRDISKKQDEPLGSRLKGWNLLHKGTKVCFFRKRQDEFQEFLSQKNNLVYCNDVVSVMEAFGHDNDTEEWRLLVDSSKIILKAVLLHNGNKFISVPIAHASNMEETYENMKLLLKKIEYERYDWKICSDLKVIALLRGLQFGYTNYFVFSALECNMTLKTHFLHSHLDLFPDNLGAVSDENGERFHKDISSMEKRYQGKWSPGLLADYCWTLKRDVPQANMETCSGNVYNTKKEETKVDDPATWCNNICVISQAEVGRQWVTQKDEAGRMSPKKERTAPKTRTSSKRTFVFNMSSSKPSGSKTKRKIADEHRNFQEKWELEYFCSEVKDKIICLICNNAISVPKLYNIKRHYEQHKSKYDTYEGLMRQEKLKEFKLGMKKQQFMFTKVSQESEAAVHASYVLSEMIAKHSKPFTEGDFIKECLIKAAEIVCPGSVKTFQAISLSRNTVVERVTDMARNLNDQIKEKSSCFEAFSIACDETTDGAPSMTGKTNGFVALLRKKLSEISDGSNIHHTHCIIHQEVLCTKVIKMENVLTPIKKFINFIRSRGLNQRQFSLFLTELESEYSGLSYYTEVRWLSCSKVLKQFWDLKEEICQFLITKNQDITLFSDQVWLQDFSFMVDITKHLSDLNLKLQGKDQIITNMCDQVNAFKCKLVLWEKQLKNEDLMHFPTCNMYKSSLGETASYQKYAEKILSLRNEFETRFSDFKSLEGKFTLFSSIFSINIESVPNHMQMEVIDIQCDSDLKAKFIEVGVSEFYKYLPARFENTRKLAYEIMSMFGSTYRCEQLFSLMKGNKSPIRSRITDVHLGSVLKLITANKISPEVGKMVAEKRCQISGRKY
ncbi:hypothetical protein LAZ67_6002396 [Cordylochernes scorpioides]|uniref:SPIN-DOC-like zinc-finger domain-containing protein n=1 Tax=Cordylochernes scorpioides TaxID=51811 RepID=A0ABY6KLM1_9ARAC|nr:hypothetical protein LAZ67_6002396 [Cordylochernes scorpioides]